MLQKKSTPGKFLIRSRGEKKHLDVVSASAVAAAFRDLQLSQLLDAFRMLRFRKGGNIFFTKNTDEMVA